MSPEEALRIALGRTGIEFPRGILGESAFLLADAIVSDAEPAQIERLVDAVASAHWVELRASIQAGLTRGLAAANDDLEAFELVLPMAARPEADHPLARALAVDAGVSLARARERARELVVGAEEAATQGGPEAALAASTAAGAAAVELLDLDPEDFEPEIVAYVEADGAEEAVAELARATGDAEIRAWARAALREVEDEEAPAATDALAHLVAGPPPADPAEDLVWVPAILTLVQLGIERAAAGGDSEDR